MKFKLEIDSSNEALAGQYAIRSLATLIRGVANHLEEYTGQDTGGIRDINGNTVGRWTLEIEE